MGIKYLLQAYLFFIPILCPFLSPCAKQLVRLNELWRLILQKYLISVY